MMRGRGAQIKHLLSQCACYTSTATGYEHRQEVTIVSVADRPRIVVATADGRQFLLDYRQYDTGADYCGPAGNWLPEEHPKVRAALQRELDKHLACGPPESASARYAWEDYAATLRWVIARNAPSGAAP